MQVKTKQIVIVVAVVALMGVLLAQPIRGLVNLDKGTEATAESSTSTVNFQTESLRGKRGVNAAIVSEITDIENRLSKVTSTSDSLALLRQLAGKWDDVNKSGPLAFVYEEIAKIDGGFDYWLRAGDAYRVAYTNLQDTVVASELTQFAIRAYQKAMELNGDDLNVKVGLGSAYVSGSDNPMAGIALLQEVVREDPNHIEANRSLGLFSMQSRQFDRAIDRFKTVVSIQPDAESFFYLATSYESIGLKREAIAAYESSKELAADPTLTQFIDRKIDELSK